jgi:hypothetical protein
MFPARLDRSQPVIWILYRGALVTSSQGPEPLRLRRAPLSSKIAAPEAHLECGRSSYRLGGSARWWYEARSKGGSCCDRTPRHFAHFHPQRRAENSWESVPNGSQRSRSFPGDGRRTPTASSPRSKAPGSPMGWQKPRRNASDAPSALPHLRATRSSLAR